MHKNLVKITHRHSREDLMILLGNVNAQQIKIELC